MHLISFYEIVFFKHYSLINLKKIFFCHLFKSRAKVFSMRIVKDITLKRKKIHVKFCSKETILIPQQEINHIAFLTPIKPRFCIFLKTNLLRQ